MTQIANDLPLCQLISTGGTIAMKIDLEKGAPLPALSGDDLVVCAPEIAMYVRLEVNNLYNVPSDYMNAERWIQLSQAVEKAVLRPDIGGVIISHGTDTLEETAWFLDLTIQTDKPIVLTGAQRNASSPDSDGPRNLLNAVRICASTEVLGLGAIVAMNNQIHAARDVSKTHTSAVESFKSGDSGQLGTVDDDRVIISRRSKRRLHLSLQDKTLPRVEIIPMFSGATGDLLDASVELGARGIVIQALGLGNVNDHMFKAIERAIAANVPVVISTRVPSGRVQPIYGFIGGGNTLKEVGAIFADNLNPQKARILLMLALQFTNHPQELQKLFDK